MREYGLPPAAARAQNQPSVGPSSSSEFWACASPDANREGGHRAAGQEPRDILALLPGFQNADGGFPHWCAGSEDIHYTGWMAMELILIERTMDDPLIETLLRRMHAFLEDRVDSSGRSHYEGPCPDDPECVIYYDNRQSGCGIDYDTRAWTVEPAYNALLFDRFHSLEYVPAMEYLVSLENGGTFADKWEFIPPPDDPEYPWSIADTSVANMSIIFWSLAANLSGRRCRSSDPPSTRRAGTAACCGKRMPQRRVLRAPARGRGDSLRPGPRGPLIRRGAASGALDGPSPRLRHARIRRSERT